MNYFYSPFAPHFCPNIAFLLLPLYLKRSRLGTSLSICGSTQSLTQPDIEAGMNSQVVVRRYYSLVPIETLPVKGISVTARINGRVWITMV